MPYSSILTTEQINKALKPFPGWKIVEFSREEKGPKSGIAVEKIFTFNSFEQAMTFMQLVSQEITKINHHPEWENNWKTVRVRLSTWDVGHQVTELDIKLARIIEEKYIAYQ